MSIDGISFGFIKDPKDARPEPEPECTCTELERMTVCCDMRNEPHLVGCPRWGFRKVKPRWKLAATTNVYYHFVNLHSSATAREHHTIIRERFWGRKP